MAYVHIFHVLSRTNSVLLVTGTHPRFSQKRHTYEDKPRILALTRQTLHSNWIAAVLSCGSTTLLCSNTNLVHWHNTCIITTLRGPRVHCFQNWFVFHFENSYLILLTLF